MRNLRVVRIKPNPAGKDRSRHGVEAAQVAAEWVDLENLGPAPASLEGVEVHHLAYPAGGQARWEKVVGLRGELASGKAVRVHSGREIPLAELRPEDVQGADFHVFAGRDLYVWNNAEGDCGGLWQRTTRAWLDKACYDPYPPEGLVLVRQGDSLVPSPSRSRWC